MNVEEYFPEGLSVIHHDESQRDGRTSNGESLKFIAAIHCHICYKNIIGPINNVDFIKPCNCQLMFVHASCAVRNRAKFGEAKCSNCGHGSTIPRSRQKHQLSYCCSDKEPPCTICNDKSYQYEPHQPNQQTHLAYKIKPCFCRNVYHFGCLRSLIGERRVCSECNVTFCGFEPAPTMQFFKNKWAWYILYVAILSMFTTLFILAVKNSLVFTKWSNNSEDINREIMLSILSVFFLIVIASTMFCVIKYSLLTAIPKFRITRGKVTLKPFKTGSHIKSPKPELEPLSETDFEEIPLNDMRNKSAGDLERPVEKARGNDVDDITLGQHMFGVYATHHSSSTPIDKPSLEFVFNSV